jgi:mono/diheme cytochrome c family protein
MLRIVSAVVAAGLLLSSETALAGNWNVPTTAKGLTNPVAWDKNAASSAGKIYANRCVECHGVQGAGDGVKARVDYDLRTIVGPLTDGELYWKITHGVGKMPSYAGALSDRERWLMVHHLRRLAQTLPGSGSAK